MSEPLEPKPLTDDQVVYVYERTLNRTIVESAGRDSAKRDTISRSAASEITSCIALITPASGVQPCPSPGWTSWSAVTGGFTTQKLYNLAGSYRVTLTYYLAGQIVVDSVERL